MKTRIHHCADDTIRINDSTGEMRMDANAEATPQDIATIVGACIDVRAEDLDDRTGEAETNQSTPTPGEWYADRVWDLSLDSLAGPAIRRGMPNWRVLEVVERWLDGIGEKMESEQ